jgi:hypothetical protein
MFDGGWKVLAFECAVGKKWSGDELDRPLGAEGLIRRMVGTTEWPRIETVYL